jgi:hypothetical protein
LLDTSKRFAVVLMSGKKAKCETRVNEN